ncbi:MAG: OmpA family protein [Gammaproteobacteria bacterium]
MRLTWHTCRVALCMTALALTGAQVSADGHDGQWYVTPMFSFVDDANDRGVDDEFAGGQLGFGRAINENWQIEFNGFAANLDDRYLNNNQQLRGFGVDWLRQFPNDSRFSPYGLLGIGFQSTKVNNGQDSNDMFGSIGIGLMTKFNDDGLALRTEARLRAVSGTPHLNDMYYSAGLQIPVGKKAPPPPADSDGDGVIDPNDRCPGTPPGTRVGPDGCELDSDGDGVVDSKDRCPNTPAGTRVDSNGCKIVEKDSDGDGVPDRIDACPNTPRGAEVDAKGCELDGDGDGVVNSKDRCPNTTKGARIDVYGCEIKGKIDLPGVQFELNSATLLPESTRVLNDAAQTLKNNGDIVVEVAGHTDSTGAASYNESLSDKRAKSVAAYLNARGIDSARLKSRGYGEAEPVADNATAEGRARNRRVELKILSRDF